MLFLSVDFGTSAVKMSILDEKLQVLDWASEEYAYILLPGEKIELAPDDLFGAFFAAAGRLDADLRAKVECLCYDTFSPSPVFMDADGGLVYPNIITHMDRRSRAQTAYIEETIGREEYMAISGIYPFVGGCSAMTLIWFVQNMPEVLEKTYRFGHLTTYVHRQLTGEWAVDFVNASMIGLYETTSQKGWSKELISTFGLKESWFGDICLPGKPLGKLLPAMAEKTGLPAGVPVCMGTNDMAAAQMGAENTKAGDILISAGSSEMVSILTNQPVTSPHYYLRNAALPGLWQIYATTAGGFATDWFYKELCKEMSRKEFFAYVDRCLSMEEDALDESVRFAPYLTGDRQSLEKKTAGWIGLTLAATRDQMLRALLDGTQEVMGGAVARADAIVPTSKTIKLTGGMVTEAYVQYKMRALPGHDIQRVDNCPTLGNAALALLYL